MDTRGIIIHMVRTFSIPEKVWFKENLRSSLRSVLVVLYHRRSRDWTAVFRSYEELGSFSGMGEERARRAVKELVRRKLIRTERSGVYRLRRGGRLISLPSSLATGVLTYKERAYLTLIWSLKELQGDGKFAYVNLDDLVRLTGENKSTVYRTIRNMSDKGLVTKERYGRCIRISPLFPILV